MGKIHAANPSYSHLAILRQARSPSRTHSRVMERRNCVQSADGVGTQFDMLPNMKAFPDVNRGVIFDIRYSNKGKRKHFVASKCDSREQAIAFTIFPSSLNILFKLNFTTCSALALLHKSYEKVLTVLTSYLL